MDDPRYYGFPCYGERSVKVGQDFKFAPWFGGWLADLATGTPSSRASLSGELARLAAGRAALTDPSAPVRRLV